MTFEKACALVRTVQNKAKHFEKVRVIDIKELGFDVETMGAPAAAARHKTGYIALGLRPSLDKHFTDRQIQALIAHEFGHIVNGDVYGSEEREPELSHRQEFDADLFAVSIGYGRELMEVFEHFRPTVIADPMHPNLQTRIDRIRYAMIEMEDERKAA